MNLGKLAQILKNRLVCASEYEIYQSRNGWYLITIFKSGYFHEQELENFHTDITELENFIDSFKQEHNISIKIVRF